MCHNREFILKRDDSVEDEDHLFDFVIFDRIFSFQKTKHATAWVIFKALTLFFSVRNLNSNSSTSLSSQT